MAAWDDMARALGTYGRTGVPVEGGAVVRGLWSALQEGAFGGMNRGLASIMEQDAAWRAAHPAQAEMRDALDLFTMAGPSVGIIRAYHGSPHVFDKFSTKAIGSGEGAQAYGHGLYFAENEKTAKAYRDNLASSRVEEFSDHALPDWIVSAATESSNPLKRLGDIHADLYDRAYMESKNLETSPQPWNVQARIDTANRLLETVGAMLDHLKSGGTLTKGQTGGLYDVTLRPDSDELLDWDLPLSQQSKKVRDKLASVGIDTTPKTLTHERKPGWGSIQDHLVGTQYESDPMGSELARGGVDKLRAAGIPGIRFLDQGSRGTAGGELIDVFQRDGKWYSKIRVAQRGDGFEHPMMVTTSAPHETEAQAREWAKHRIESGTRNIVIFDDADVHVNARDGKPVKAQRPAWLE